MNSLKIGGLIQESGYLASYNSEYLRKKNWMQICLMGECTHEKVVSLLNAMNRVCFKRARKVEAAEA
jgi:predicted DNA-binding protein (MmcQ/YjbR family)